MVVLLPMYLCELSEQRKRDAIKAEATAMRKKRDELEQRAKRARSVQRQRISLGRILCKSWTTSLSSLSALQGHCAASIMRHRAIASRCDGLAWSSGAAGSSTAGQCQGRSLSSWCSSWCSSHHFVLLLVRFICSEQFLDVRRDAGLLSTTEWGASGASHLSISTPTNRLTGPAGRLDALNV